MPWLASASVKSSTVAPACVSAFTMSFSISVRSASVRSALSNVNEYRYVGSRPSWASVANPPAETSATPNDNVFTVKSELFSNSAWLSAVVMMPHTVKSRPARRTVSPTDTSLFLANTRSMAISSPACGASPCA